MWYSTCSRNRTCLIAVQQKNANAAVSRMHLLLCYCQVLHCIHARVRISRDDAAIEVFQADTVACLGTRWRLPGRRSARQSWSLEALNGGVNRHTCSYQSTASGRASPRLHP